MARKVRDAALNSRAARLGLKPRGRPYWRMIESKVHLGYRRLKGKAGSWSVRWYVEGKRTYSVELLNAVADDINDANEREILSFDGAVVAVRERMASRGKAKPYTVKDAVEAYLKARAILGRDVADARGRAVALIYPTLGETLVSDLTADDIEAWRDQLAASPPRVRTKAGASQRYRKFTDSDEAVRRRRSSANRVLTILRAALNHAFRKGKGKGKVASDAEWRKVERFKGVDASRLRYLTVDEARRLVNAADADFRPLVTAALQTGARIGQLARFIVADFNSDAGTVRLSTQKGDGTARVFHCTLTPEGVTFFKQHCAGRAGSELMFINTGRLSRAAAKARPNRPAPADPGEWRASEQERPMAAACRRAKIDPPISFHGLRHTWASLAVMGGTPLFVVAKNLGHTDTRMVEKHYGHLSTGYLRDAIHAGAPRFGIEPNNVTQIRG